MLKEREKHPPGPIKKDMSHDVTYLPKLSDLGIERMQSVRWQNIASIVGFICFSNRDTIIKNL